MTNSYCIVANSTFDSFARSFELELDTHHIPVISTSIGANRAIGRTIVGNSHGLLLPNITTDQEFFDIRNSLPDRVNVVRIDEQLSALGNVIVANDSVALVHPEIDLVL